MESEFERLLTGNGNIQAVHKKFSSECFNRAWEMIEKKSPNEEDLENMLLSCHASLWHWKQREDCQPVNLSVAYWQLGRVNNLAAHFGMAESYGNKCVRISKAANLPPFYLGYGYEALAQTAALTGQTGKAMRFLDEAFAQLAKVENKDGAKYLGSDLEQVREILAKKQGRLRQGEHVITGVNHITLAVGDLTRSFRFYVDVLGLKPIAKWSRGAYLSAGKDWFCLSLDAATRKGPHPEYTHLAFSVSKDDFPGWVERIQSSDAMPWKENTSEGDSLYFLDPDGHKLEVHVGNLESRLAALKEKPYPGLEWYGNGVE